MRSRTLDDGPCSPAVNWAALQWRSLLAEVLSLPLKVLLQRSRRHRAVDRLAGSGTLCPAVLQAIPALRCMGWRSGSFRQQAVPASQAVLTQHPRLRPSAEVLEATLTTGTSGGAVSGVLSVYSVACKYEMTIYCQRTFFQASALVGSDRARDAYCDHQATFACEVHASVDAMLATHVSM